MVQSAQNRKLEKDREQANLALAPVEDDVEALRKMPLQELSLTDQFIVQPSTGSARTSGFQLETYPIFFVTDNLEGLSLKNVVVLHELGSDLTAPIYQNVVEVVSPVSVNEYTGELADEGEFKAAVKTLYQKSVLLALQDIKGNLGSTESTSRTFRHEVNGLLRLERGVAVKESCDEIVVRNLRGWLISLPQTDSVAECGDANFGKVGRITVPGANRLWSPEAPSGCAVVNQC